MCVRGKKEAKRDCWYSYWYTCFVVVRIMIVSKKRIYAFYVSM